jgi:hypothetical protein
MSFVAGKLVPKQVFELGKLESWNTRNTVMFPISPLIQLCVDYAPFQVHSSLFIIIIVVAMSSVIENFFKQNQVNPLTLG